MNHAQQLAGGFLGNHFVYGKPVPVEHIQWIPPDWFYHIILTCLLMVAFIQIFFPRRFRMILRTAFSWSYSNQLVREGNLFRERISVVLLAVNLLTMSAFIYILFSIFTNITDHFPPFHLYLMIFLLVLFYWAIKFLATNILGDIFYNKTQSSEIQLSNFLINVFAGILILLFLLPILYSETRIFLYITLSLLLILLVIKILRGFSIGLSHTKFSVLHLFLYLCTLEILPLLLIMKAVNDFSKNL